MEGPQAAQFPPVQALAGLLLRLTGSTGTLQLTVLSGTASGSWPQS